MRLHSLTRPALHFLHLFTAGVPLLEIVSTPDMRSGRDAYLYGEELRRVLRFAGVSNGNMAEGSMRCDVNVSVSGDGAVGDVAKQVKVDKLVRKLR